MENFLLNRKLLLDQCLHLQSISDGHFNEHRKKGHHIKRHKLQYINAHTQMGCAMCNCGFDWNVFIVDGNMHRLHLRGEWKEPIEFEDRKDREDRKDCQDQKDQKDRQVIDYLGEDFSMNVKANKQNRYSRYQPEDDNPLQFHFENDTKKVKII